ncbi:hypothetical protein PUN28_004133 [Cardiocondyla obscurior]|uniref:Uncharacterized protein n=1 Tax=Cardiocondyla obscurior TaxID=286306 RepID=A0AAW2GPP7_9HYME
MFLVSNQRFKLIIGKKLYFNPINTSNMSDNVLHRYAGIRERIGNRSAHGPTRRTEDECVNHLERIARDSDRTRQYTDTFLRILSLVGGFFSQTSSPYTAFYCYYTFKGVSGTKNICMPRDVKWERLTYNTKACVLKTWIPYENYLLHCLANYFPTVKLCVKC